MKEHQLDLVEHINTLERKDLYTVEQALKLLNISRPTIYRRMKTVGVESHKIGNVGYFDQDMIELLSRTRVKAGCIKKVISVKNQDQSDSVLSLLREISSKLSVLIAKIETPVIQTTSKSSKNGSNKRSSSSNEQRAEKSRKGVIEAYLELKQANRLPLDSRGNVIYAQFAEITKISRGTVSKYLKEYLSD